MHTAVRHECFRWPKNGHTDQSQTSRSRRGEGQPWSKRNQADADAASCSRAPRWARPLIVILLIALVIGWGYFRTADPLENSGLANGPVVPLLVIALGLTSVFWGATRVSETERARMSQGLTWDRLIAKLPVPAIRGFLIVVGLAITALGVAALFD